MTAELNAMSGYELMEWIRTTRPTDVPSIGRLLGMHLTSVGHGEVTFELNTQPDFSNPLGTVHGGIAATMLDSAMGCAVHTTLPAGVGYTTLELKVNYIRSVAVDGRTLIAEGKVIHSGRTTATAEGRVYDEGKLVAHGTTTCIILNRTAI